MEPELKKFYVIALVGLFAFFPVFNQVKATSLDALRNSDHEGQWSSFFKSWDDIPPDERLDYWDGRSKPPGAGDDFDRGRVDDDARIREGQRPDGTGPDDGTDRNDTDTDTDKEAPPRYRLVETVLWERSFTGRLSNNEEVIQVDHHLESLNFTWDHASWTGEANFALFAEGSRVWDRPFGTPQMPMVMRTDNGRTGIDGTGTATLRIDWDYNPITTPDRFDVRLLGTYKEYIE